MFELFATIIILTKEKSSAACMLKITWDKIPDV
jgi:hypothetical protein